jgi:hypothetical protein
VRYPNVKLSLATEKAAQRAAAGMGYLRPVITVLVKARISVMVRWRDLDWRSRGGVEWSG